MSHKNSLRLSKEDLSGDPHVIIFFIVMKELLKLISN